MDQKLHLVESHKSTFWLSPHAGIESSKAPWQEARSTPRTVLFNFLGLMIERRYCFTLRNHCKFKAAHETHLMKAFEAPNMEIRLKSGPEFHNLDCVFLGIDSGTTKPSALGLGSVVQLR